MRMDPWGTHQPLLAAVIAATRGPIVELGGGWYSTPLVAAASHGSGRLAFTIETDDAFYEVLKGYTSPSHRILRLAGMAAQITADPAARTAMVDRQNDLLERLWTEDLQRQPTSVVLVDQDPGFLRRPSIEFFADKAEYVVIHDTELTGRAPHEPTLSAFRSRWDLRLREPHTTVVSNRHDCTRFAWVDPTAGRGLPPALAPPPAPPARLPPSLRQRLREATRPERRALARLFGLKPKAPPKP